MSICDLHTHSTASDGRYTPEQERFYLRLSEKYKLQATGGSDFYRENVKLDVKLAALK